MNFDSLLAAIKAGRPYFGEEVLGVQGNPERQRHMTDLVGHICSERNHQPIKILEIGSWIGASAITWASAIQLYNDGSGQVFCIDPWMSNSTNQNNRNGWDLHMENLLKNDFAFDLFNHNIQSSKMAPIIQAFRGLSSSIAPNFSDETFDIIYIDGAHDYESVKLDIQIAIPKLINFGVLCGDDFELHINDVDKREIKNLIENGIDFYFDEKTKSNYHPGVTLAVSEAIKNVGSRDGFWFAQKNNDNWKTVDFPSIASIPEHIAQKSFSKS